MPVMLATLPCGESADKVPRTGQVYYAQYYDPVLEQWMPDSKRKVVIVGAGLSGLCCARTLQRAGCEAHLFEATGGVGGRVRTDVVDGFRLDRGFQVLFTAYPSVRQELDLPALKLRCFDTGAIIYHDGVQFILGDPLRKPTQILPTAFSGLIGLRDKLRMLRMRRTARTLSVEEIFTLPDKCLEEDLRDERFSEDFINRVIRPLFGGIFLDHSLFTSARMYAFVWKMLIEGKIAVPEKGMGAIGRQIARDLEEGTLHLQAPVAELTRSGGRVTGIRLEDGEVVEADAVVVATAADTAARLTGVRLPQEHRSCVCLYFSVPRLYREKMLMLFAEPNKYTGKEQRPLVNNATLMTNVAPSYAPEGRHLLSATVLGRPEIPDDELAQRVMQEIAPHFRKPQLDTWRLLRIYRIPWAQFQQPVGIFDRLPSAEIGIPGLILAGEITHSSSIHGALVSGQKAAALAMSAE